MSPPSPRRPDCAPALRPAKNAARRHASGGWIVAAALLLTLAGCNARVVRDDKEVACVNRCRETREQCDDNARWEYKQCQAGYSAAQRDYRWCNSADWDQCGYPWWSCSQNLYGYCSNRDAECRRTCRRPRG